jgi:hypothetical protein
MYRDCPHRSEKVRFFHNVQQDEKVEDTCKNVPKIYAALDNKQVEFQSHMIEVEGMINNQTIVNLIDLGAIHSYIDANMVEIFHFPSSNNWKSWLVQLATRAKRKANEMVKSCSMGMNGMSTK